MRTGAISLSVSSMARKTSSQPSRCMATPLALQMTTPLLQYKIRAVTHRRDLSRMSAKSVDHGRHG